MSKVPFFGICGLRNNDEYRRLTALAKSSLAGTERFLMAGVKDIDGDLDTIIMSDNVRPFIHCDYNATQPYDALVLDRLKKSQAYARGLQLNVVPWMETDFTGLWKLLREQYPQVRLMLQAHGDIMERYTPTQIAHRLRGQRVDYILFDASQSRGVPYDPVQMREYVRAIYDQNIPVGVVVSGGLGPDTVREILSPLLVSFPELSCDAFFQLQDPATGSLSWPVVERYLVNLQELLIVTKLLDSNLSSLKRDSVAYLA